MKHINTMAKTLVTGAAGFVGREVVRQLLDNGTGVTGLGRSELPESEIRGAQAAWRAPYVQADLTDAASLQQALAGHSFGCIIHLASLPGDTGDPRQMVQANIVGCQNVLEYAREMQISRFVLASSISAYEWYPATKFNPPDRMPVDENHPCRPKDMYSTTKRMQELLTHTYYHQYGLPVTALRLTAVVGPRGRGGGRGWLQFARQLAEGRRLQVPHFSSEELCHYVDIRDVARMLVAAASLPGAVGQTFNCCGPSPTRGAEFVDIIKRLAPDIEVEFGFPWSMAQGGEIAFDMSKARELLGFEPLHTLADSIESIVEWIDGGGLEEEEATDESYGTGVGEND